MDIWEWLDIPPSTDIAEIKSAYARQAKIYHPEEHPEEFKALQNAYKTALRIAKCQGTATYVTPVTILTEDENVRYLMEKAQRLYQECSPKVRAYIAEQLAGFRNIIMYERSPRARREACVQFSIYLAAVERNKFDFHGFDESFFADDREDE